MMCQACEEGRHWDCGMQMWCECDCLGPEGEYPDFPDYGMNDTFEPGDEAKETR